MSLAIQLAAKVCCRGKNNRKREGTQLGLALRLSVGNTAKEERKRREGTARGARARGSNSEKGTEPGPDTWCQVLWMLEEAPTSLRVQCGAPAVQGTHGCGISQVRALGGIPWLADRQGGKQRQPGRAWRRRCGPWVRGSSSLLSDGTRPEKS